MVVLEEALRAVFPAIDLSYVAQNVSGATPVVNGVDATVAAVLNELGALQRPLIDENSLDLALYQVACLQLQARIDCIEQFPQKLAAFRSRCAAH